MHVYGQYNPIWIIFHLQTFGSLFSALGGWETAQLPSTFMCLPHNSPALFWNSSSCKNWSSAPSKPWLPLPSPRTHLLLSACVHLVALNGGMLCVRITRHLSFRGRPFTSHDVLRVHLCWSRCRNSLPFWGWVIFFVRIGHILLIRSSINRHWAAFTFGYGKQHCCEHGCANTSSGPWSQLL